jgi:hypothetical protein
VEATVLPFSRDGLQPDLFASEITTTGYQLARRKVSS